MRLNALSLITGAVVALTVGTAAEAVPTIFAVSNTTDPWLVANGLQSAVLRINGFSAGEYYQGFIGAPAWNWIVATDGPGGFWNINTVEDPGNPGTFLYEDGFYAAPTGNIALNNATGNTAQWDSGLLGDPATLGEPAGFPENDTPGGFALFSDGSDDVNISPVAWISIQSGGIAVPDFAIGDGPGLPVLRVTWAANEAVTVQLELIMSTPAVPHYLNITIPPVPAPAALALFALAGLVRSTRRRD
ncbi:MAG: hypothetical protein L0Y44_01535 [Phycisphaerales bacterium]|nr:hypothetical protein [Phycisphaerales bacterium]MCI0629319.1 hypothetical protein [Phycisphaerales bacterium]MCI0676985.1 hypothetical protein [Phycisphaerales bacterium]